MKKKYFGALFGCYVPLPGTVEPRDEVIKKPVQKDVNGRLLTVYDEVKVSPKERYKDLKCSDFSVENLQSIGNEQFFKPQVLQSGNLDLAEKLAAGVAGLNPSDILDHSTVQSPSEDVVPPTSPSEPSSE